MTNRKRDLAQLVEQVQALAEEMKLLTLNLTVANAKLRARDSAFQSVNASFCEMLDIATFAYDEAALAVKKVKGEPVVDKRGDHKPVELGALLDRIKALAEHVVSTVVALKQDRGVDQHL